MIGYALVSHFALILPDGKKIAALLALSIPTCGLIWFLFQWAQKKASKSDALGSMRWLCIMVVFVLSCVVVITPLWWIWPMVLSQPDALYFAQHLGTNALMAWVFGLTLRAGSTPLIVRFARMVHTNLPMEIESYARKVTVAWLLFFVITCLVSVMLFVWAPLSAWSTFAVLLQWPSVGAFFVGEYILRKLLFRQFKHASLKQGFDAYQLMRVQNPVGLPIKSTAPPKQ